MELGRRAREGSGGRGPLKSQCVSAARSFANPLFRLDEIPPCCRHNLRPPYGQTLLATLCGEIHEVQKLCVRAVSCVKVGANEKEKSGEG